MFGGRIDGRTGAGLAVVAALLIGPVFAGESAGDRQTGDQPTDDKRIDNTPINNRPTDSGPIDGPIDGQPKNDKRDILVTFVNDGARRTAGGSGQPYRYRKRYSISAEVRRNARGVAADYSLTAIDDWPIRSLGVYCFVYRVAAAEDLGQVITLLRGDRRVESVQLLQAFDTGTTDVYDDTYAGLQHGLNALGLGAAHRHATGRGVRVAIVDSNVDSRHEDLRGRVAKVHNFARTDRPEDQVHGTAVTSIIGANANNAVGIVGIAPGARVELFVACWARRGTDTAMCDSFTLSKAIDAVLEDPPDVLNLSLNGPFDPLLSRLIAEAHRRGVIVIAAVPNNGDDNRQFPASMEQVIGVDASRQPGRDERPDTAVYAPGSEIIVAIPDDDYAFRSGTSLAAAHVSGVVALVLSVAPDLASADIARLLRESQRAGERGDLSVDACLALQLANRSLPCRG